MEYTINKLAKIAGITTRTLRHYDKIGLLKPSRINSSGYRIYGQREIDLLQQILFYRELGVSLENIKSIISAPNFDSTAALESHLTALLDKKKQLNKLIANVRKSILAAKGEVTMSDNQKFEGFKEKLIDDNEVQYGAEIRGKYGDDAIDFSNAKVKSMSEEQWRQAESLREEINATLKVAMESGEPSSELAQKACDLHRQWLCMFWKDGTYSKEAHRGLGEMYVADERFKAHYEKVAEGCAEFLREAINIYCK
ncbi:MAG: MerR family transcriptional regulator [Oscillospiraceae bacterium]|nr:MerR family transcriptional regulator [Oscillospiraceae bacterium]